jgi:hypothetical protein
MHSPPVRIATAWPLLAGLLACTMPGAGRPARAQSPPDARAAARAGDVAGPAGEPAGAQAKAKVKAKVKEDAPDPAKARAQAPRREPSEEYKESIRKTVEKRRQRRARRAQGQGPDDPRPVGAIGLWPMPPALIIRQTPEVHDEIGSLLGQLRRAGG